MTTLTVSLPEADRAFAEAQAAAEGLASAGDYMRSLLREARRKDVKRALDEKIRQTLKEPATEMTQADWDEIRREIIERSPELRDQVGHAVGEDQEEGVDQR